MNKITDIEIINDLKREIDIAEEVDRDYCDEVPVELIQSVIDLINHLKAEIKRLKAVAEAELDTIHDMGEDYERVLEEKPLLIQKARAEAIKEFAERLKITDLSGVVGEHYINGEMYGYFDNGAFGGVIDNLVKEMTENEGKE